MPTSESVNRKKIESLESVNAELLTACKTALSHMDRALSNPYEKYAPQFWYHENIVNPLRDAIQKAEALDK